jgi:hypothetical protein
MENLQLKAQFNSNQSNFHVGLSLVEFNEDDNVIVYSPALDLSGYGKNPEEAKNSFSEALKEFIRYTDNKNTMQTVLSNLGWKIKGSKNKRKYNPPKDSDLISNNPLYSDIVNTKNYKVSREEIELAF